MWGTVSTKQKAEASLKRRGALMSPAFQIEFPPTYRKHIHQQRQHRWFCPSAAATAYGG